MPPRPFQASACWRSADPITLTAHISFKPLEVKGIGVAPQENAMPPKASLAMLGYVLSGAIVVPIAVIILHLGPSSNLECIGLHAHCPYDGVSKWMMLTAAVAIAVDIALVVNLFIGRVRAWLNERPGD